MPVEQRQKKGIESMTLWVTMLEAIFRKKGQAWQIKIDTWLTGTTPRITGGRDINNKIRIHQHWVVEDLEEVF